MSFGNNWTNCTRKSREFLRVFGNTAFALQFNNNLKENKLLCLFSFSTFG